MRNWFWDVLIFGVSLNLIVGAAYVLFQLILFVADRLNQYNPLWNIPFGVTIFALTLVTVVHLAQKYGSS